MISIVTRCLNRLEYTVLVVNAVHQLSGDEQYEHIIIDNGSNDGTREWFNWMFENTSWLDKVRYVRYDKNLGDWGGMAAAQKFFNPSTKYVVQLDNDILVSQNWLKALRTVIDNTEFKAVMCKRDNVAWKLKALSQVMNVNGYEVVKVERVVACFMTDINFFSTACQQITVDKQARSKYIISQLAGHKVAKIINVHCWELEAEYQRVKYNPKNKKIWEKI